MSNWLSDNKILIKANQVVKQNKKSRVSFINPSNDEENPEQSDSSDNSLYSKYLNKEQESTLVFEGSKSDSRQDKTAKSEQE